MRVTAQKTGRAAAHAVAMLALFSLAWAGSARAAAAVSQFTAVPDRTHIGQDESLSLRISIRTDGRGSVSDPTLTAPDFEVLNEFNSSSTQMSTTMNENGMLETKTTETSEVTKILRPLKTGRLTIGGIQVTIDGKAYRAPDVVIDVGAPGAGTPPPKNYGGGGVGLRGAGKQARGSPVFLRAEVDKDKAYKGEQLVVSYYLYQRTRTFNIDITKYPSLEGFLREDLEMPILGRRLEAERTVVDGVPYERYLLVRYAAYPLQEGKLRLDSMMVKYNYYAGNGQALDTEDDPFMNFFRNLTPRAGTSTSEPLTVQVNSLPEEGRPASFSGGVGDFSVIGAVDKYDVRANEAVTVTVKVEGRGNLAAVTEPKAKWPDNVELYDTKGRAKTGRGGVGEKVFEYLLIPRVPGKLELPGLEFSFFDPARKAYVTKTTEPISISVHEPAAGSPAYVPTAKPQAASPGQPRPNVVGGVKDEPMGLKPPGGPSGGLKLIGQEGWHILYWIFAALFTLFLAIVGYDLVRRTHANSLSAAETKSRAYAKSWERLKLAAKEATNGAAWAEVSRDYERLAGLVFDAIDKKYKVGARSLPRAELREKLVVERGMPEDLWKAVSHLFEFAELVRFASSVGGVSEAAARSALSQWVKAGEDLVHAIDRIETPKEIGLK